MEVKEIFLEAAKLIESGYSRWMCTSIKRVLYPDRESCDVEVPENLNYYGFSKENYEKFIYNNYPELGRYILNKYVSSGKYSEPWINTIMLDSRILKSIIKSKVEFLKSLANGS